MKRIAIVQSNYIPWRGYFDIIASVDEFILYDDMQFTKNDWRNRNRIKTPSGPAWITIPVGRCIDRRIRDVELPSPFWQEKHWKTLEVNYRKAPHFEEIAALLAPIYRDTLHTHLSPLNRALIETVCGYLGITTKITSSWDYELGEGKTERLVDLCRQANATEYVSGPAARGYVDAGLFELAGIDLTWFDYGGYPSHPQLWGGFVGEVSIVDLLMNCGSESGRYMKFVDGPPGGAAEGDPR